MNHGFTRPHRSTTKQIRRILSSHCPAAR